MHILAIFVHPSNFYVLARFLLRGIGTPPHAPNRHAKSTSSNNFFQNFFIFYFLILVLLCIYALFVVLSVFLAHFGCFMYICMFLFLDMLRTHYLLLCFIYILSKLFI